MNAVVLLLFVTLAANFAYGTNVFLPTGGIRPLNVIGRQLADKIISRISGDIRIDDTTLPIADEIQFDDQHVDLCGPILCISANLTKGNLAGLAGYDILKFDFKSDGTEVIIDFDIFLPNVQLGAEYYEMTGNIMQALPLSGQGRLYFEITGIRFWTTIVLQVTDHTSIKSFNNSGFNISSIFSRTEFDGNIDGIFNAMVGELLAERLNRFNKIIAAYCGDMLKEFINPILN